MRTKTLFWGVIVVASFAGMGCASPAFAIDCPDGQVEAQWPGAHGGCVPIPDPDGKLEEQQMKKAGVWNCYIGKGACSPKQQSVMEGGADLWRCIRAGYCQGPDK